MNAENRKNNHRVLVSVAAVLVLAVVAVVLWNLSRGADNGVPPPDYTEQHPACDEVARALPTDGSEWDADDPSEVIVESSEREAESDEVPPEPVLDGPMVQVVCMDALTQYPVDDFSVELELPSNREYRVESTDGTADIPADFHRADVTAEGYLRSTLRHGGDRQSISVQLEPLLGIGLVVKGGRPVIGCAVEWIEHMGASTSLGVTDKEGRFSYPIVKTRAFILRATSDGGIGSLACLPGQPAATVEIFTGASLRVISDQPLPSLEVYSNGALEARHEGGGNSVTLSPLVPFDYISLQRVDGGQVARLQLGPPGSEELLLLPPEIPKVWLHLHDENGHPIEDVDGATVVLTEGRAVSRPPIENNPLRVKTSLGSLSAAGRGSRIDLSSGDGVLAYQGNPSTARPNGDHWVLRMYAIANLSGQVVKPDGTPAEGARVVVGSLVVHDTAYTNSDGEFRLDIARNPSREEEFHLYAEWRELRATAAGTGSEPLLLELKPARELMVQAMGLSEKFTVSWKATDGPRGAPVPSANGLAVLRVPKGVTGGIQLRSGIYRVERDVDARETRVVVDFGGGPDLDVKATKGGEPAGGLRVSGVLQSERLGGPAHDGPEYYYVHFATGSDGTARITLPRGGVWTFSSTLDGGFVDTSRSTTLKLFKRTPPETVTVYGLKNWHNYNGDRYGGMYQSDRVFSEPMDREDFRDTGASLARPGDWTSYTYSYIAKLDPDKPYVYIQIDRSLVHVGTITSTSEGWRCDLTLSDEYLPD